ncbi:Dual specificity protein kinase TTK [Halotydeus destructor]|nr:Dual specificity protein kinase TTK [Halotydeus destructor]
MSDARSKFIDSKLNATMKNKACGPLEKEKWIANNHLLIKSVKTPSPPKLSASSLAHRHTMRFPNSSNRTGYTCSNRLFQTPSTGIFSLHGDKQTAEKKTTEDSSTKLHRLAEIGLLDKLKSMQFTGNLSETVDEEDEDNLPSSQESDENASPNVMKAVPKKHEESIDPSDGSIDTVRQGRKLRLSKSETDLAGSLTNLKKSRSRESVNNLSQNNRSKTLVSTSSLSNSSTSNEASELKKFKVKGKVYVLLSLLGQGGSAKVYQVFEPVTQRNLAMKVVDLSKADESTKQGYENEIQLLKKLAHCKRVVRLVDYDKLRGPDGVLKKLFLVMEKGDADLANVLKQFIETDSKYMLDPHLIKHYWKEMLKAVDEIHSMDVVHSDLKPVNFITVAGKLKLIDFGIANAIQSDHTSVIKDTQIGTINYMAPEALQSRSDLDPDEGRSGKPFIKFNCKADIWSLGCILYNLVYGRPPFGHLPNLVSKVQAICNPKHIIAYPSHDDRDLVDCLKKCLNRDPRRRPTANELLDHPYLSHLFHNFSEHRTECSNCKCPL